MRRRNKSAAFEVHAIGGLHVVLLAWDFARPDPADRKSLLGFAIERAEFDASGDVIERYMLRGIKRFKGKDEGLAAGSPVPVDEHPIQSFGWGDYTCKPGTTYEYRVIPVYGKPKLLELRQGSSVAVKVTTETERATSNGEAQHDVYFNRGVIGSQAYARKFQNATPDVDDPDSPEMKWLSRGLFEALLRFLDDAKDERFSIRAAFYEFKYAPIANAFRAAHERGVDVKIVYDATKTYGEENLATLVAAQLDSEDIAIARTVSEGIRHNKFVVLLENNVPIAVWTGSTNISAGGIFGHSNVGHVVRDKTIAKAYFEYWDRLAENLTAGKLRPLNLAATPTPANKIAKDTTDVLFSPRDPKDAPSTLEWYAARMAEAKELMCITLAFHLDELFRPFLSADNNVLRFIVKDDPLRPSEDLGQNGDVVFAAGAYLAAKSLENFRAERDNPLNSNNYIHNKFMLVDPLSDDPFVVTGSANFSRPSQASNDENMLLIRGDKRVADIYLGEFMRIFDHHYSRYVVRKLGDASDPGAGWLRETTSEWLDSHLDQTSHKWKRRKYMVYPKP